MTSTGDVAENLARARRLVKRAAGRGAALVALPENCLYLRKEGRPLEFTTEIDGPEVRELVRVASEGGCHLLIGSIPERIPRSRRVFNTSLLFGRGGDLIARYRKIHLFDISIPGGVELFESKTVKAGDRVVVADTALGRLGLSICYDLRFPELYRAQSLDGARVLFVPAAFTAYTGPFHWLPLLRARAIENQCWVVAPAQVGRHNPDRESHGETVVIDPWGEVVARKAKGEGLVEARIDYGEVDKVRAGLPCLRHTRPSIFRHPPRRRV